MGGKKKSLQDNPYFQEKLKRGELKKFKNSYMSEVKRVEQNVDYLKVRSSKCRYQGRAKQKQSSRVSKSSSKSRIWNNRAISRISCCTFFLIHQRSDNLRNITILNRIKNELKEKIILNCFTFSVFSSSQPRPFPAQTSIHLLSAFLSMIFELQYASSSLLASPLYFLFLHSISAFLSKLIPSALPGS